MHLRTLRLTAVLALILPFSLAAQTSSGSQPASPQASKPAVKKVAPAYTDPSSGKEMYQAYCASCHGVDGDGNGPAAAALKAPPTNLTMLAIKNHGIFPDAHIAQIIKGDSMSAAHGNKDMPVWGPVFLQMAGHDTAQVQLRIRNLTKYLESIQKK